MLKNLIGLHKMKFTKSVLNKQNEINEPLDNRSEKDLFSLALDDYDVENDEENDFFGENSCYNNEIKDLNKLNESISLNEDIEIDDEYDNDDSYLKKNVAEKEISNNLGYEVRLDLINEIKDEIFDNSSMNSFNELKSNDFKIQDEEDDEEEKDLENEKNPNYNINLNNLRICIDDIEELVDKSNKTCHVFVIQVWNLKPNSIHNETIENHPDAYQSNDPKDPFKSQPSWTVKRKYDEFYVLDSRLREFHGGLIDNSEVNINNQITAQLPSKQRAIFFIGNTKNVEFFHSIKNDFAKYLQVSFMLS